MTRRFSSISVQTTLATSISNNALSLVVAVGTASTLLGGISLTAGNVDQFKITLDPDTASAEIVYVTGVTSDTLTIVRGRDGTSGVTHTGGAVIKHVLTGEDLTFFATTVVPIETLSTGLPFPGSSSGTATVKAPAVAGSATITLPGATGTLATLSGTEVLTNKDLTSTTNLLPPGTGTGSLVYASSPTLVTPVLGVATATSINGAALDNLAWTAWTPVVTQGVTVTHTDRCTYKKIGKLATIAGIITITGDGTAANLITISLPVTPANSGTIGICGSGVIQDASANAFYPTIANVDSSLFYFLSSSGTTTPGSGMGSSGFTAALANGDKIEFTITVEVA